MATRTRKTAASTPVVSEDNTFQNFITELSALCAKYDTTVPAASTAAKAEPEAEEEAPVKPTRGRSARGASKTTASAPEADDEDDEGEDEGDGPSRADLEKKTVAALRKLLKATGEYKPEDIAEADKETLIAALLGDDEDDEEDEDEEDDEEGEEEADEDDDDDEEDEDDLEDRRAEYSEMTLAELRKMAREEPYNADPSELKPMKKDELIDFLLESDADDESDDDLEDEEEDGYSEEELEAMDVDGLAEIAEEWEVDEDIEKPKRMTAKAKATYKTELIEAILEAQDEE